MISQSVKEILDYNKTEHLRALCEARGRGSTSVTESNTGDSLIKSK